MKTLAGDRRPRLVTNSRRTTEPRNQGSAGEPSPDFSPVSWIDHTKLTFKFQGRDSRLTDMHGELVKKLLA